MTGADGTASGTESIRVSVIIPTFDRKDLLIDTLESVRAQTYKPHEVLLMDNGTQTASLPTEGFEWVRHIRLPIKAGASQARNMGAVIATGSVLAFLDDDDLWAPEYLKNVVAAFADESQIVVSRLDQLVGETVVPYKSASGILNVARLFIENPGVTGSNLAVRRSTFFLLGGFDTKLTTSEDKSIAIDALLQDLPIKTLPDNQAIIRHHQRTDRLSDERTREIGLAQFLAKYRSIMSRRQRAYVRYRIYLLRARRSRRAAAWLMVLRVYVGLQPPPRPTGHSDR